ncbi:hypothetical protein ACFPN2_08495 [Steroidobacter flavus]|uniref:Class I lanthipeptide n=1 Tax=Steroidobacter flavus TaxID=1842136 RepID=A0ABV8SP28_9GAMM
MTTKKKLVLDRETLKVLTPKDASRVQGGAARPISEMADCTAGKPCTSGCTTNSKNCYPCPC